MSAVSKNTLLLIISVLISGGTFYAIGRGPIAGLENTINQIETENIALQSQVEELNDSSISQEEYDTLVSVFTEVQNQYDSLSVIYNNLEEENERLEGQISDLEMNIDMLTTEIAKYVPLETGELGKSRFNSASIDTTLYLEFTVNNEEGYSCKMKITDVVRGEAALEMVVEADGWLRELWYEVEKYQNLTQQYLEIYGENSVFYLDMQDNLEYAVNRLDQNNPVQDGYEFLLVKVHFTYLTGPISVSLSGDDFMAISESGIIYKASNVEIPSPAFDVELLPSSSFEGWCVYEVIVGDEHPRLSFASHADGTGGIWFNLG